MGDEGRTQMEELSPDELEAYVHDGVFQKVDNHREHLALHPFWLTKPKQGVLEELRKTLGKWNSKLNAYVVGFENVASDTATAAINEDHKWLHVDVILTFYLYQPKKEQKLKGIVQKTALQAVICTLFNVFSATVFPSSPEELNEWSLGDEISFKITSFQNRRKGPVIRAHSILSDSSEDKSFKKKKKRKKEKIEIEEFDENWG